MKYIVVTGGVISGVGKGICSSSIGLLLKVSGFNVTSIKIDPYLNVDPGTISPLEHGECYVLNDGAEVDLDLGNYERFLDIRLTKDHSITSGKIYQTVLNNERKGLYLGKTVQIIPHITDEIQRCISTVSHISVDNGKQPDVCMIEIGGTVDDLEVIPFIKALQQLSFKLGRDNFKFVHVSMVIKIGDDLKTKPIQQGVSKLQSLGIYPDILVVRTPSHLPEECKNKISNFCGVNKDNIISNIDVPNIYFIPKVFLEQDILNKLGFPEAKPNLSEYNKTILYFNTPKKTKYNIAIAGKYVGSNDTYLSLLRAIEHASFMFEDINFNIIWLNTDEDNIIQNIEGVHGIIIPGGFGLKGIHGKIQVAKYARENNIPLLGICLGMQIMVVEFCRNVCGIIDATSKEWSNEGTYVVDILDNQNEVYGATMKLGEHKSKLIENCKVSDFYGTTDIKERHRHRYEINDKYFSIMEQHGLKFVGGLDVAEHSSLKYYIGCQYHPEFNTRYNKPHPLFVNFLKSIL